MTTHLAWGSQPSCGVVDQRVVDVAHLDEIDCAPCRTRALEMRQRALEMRQRTIDRVVRRARIIPQDDDCLAAVAVLQDGRELAVRGDADAGELLERLRALVAEHVDGEGRR